MKQVLDIQKIINFINKRNTGKIGEYTMCEGGETTLYSSCFAAMGLHYLGALSNVTLQDKREWSEYINSWQDKETGLYIGPEVVKEELTSPIHDYEYVTMHLTAHVLPALSILGSNPRYQLHFAYRFTESRELLQWLKKRDWSNAWLEGNNLLFVGQFLIYLRDVEHRKQAAESLNLYFDWLDSQMDPKTGLWGTNGYCSPFVAMCGGYHQLLVYYYENREVKYKERLVDTVLSLQHPDGGFHPKGGGGTCEDVDATDILVNMYKQINYRRTEIRSSLRRLLTLINNKKTTEGGYVYRLNERFAQGGALKTRTPANKANMFSTWFYVHLLALISEVLTDEQYLRLDWKFNDTSSMGWHRPWDKSTHNLSWQERMLASYLVSDVQWFARKAYRKIRRLSHKVI